MSQVPLQGSLSLGKYQLSLLKKKSRVENPLGEQKSLWPFSKANFNNTFKGREVQPQVKWFDLFFASLEEPQNLHSSILFYFLLDCTDCFCGNDTLPGKVTES